MHYMLPCELSSVVMGLFHYVSGHESVASHVPSCRSYSVEAAPASWINPAETLSFSRKHPRLPSRSSSRYQRMACHLRYQQCVYRLFIPH